MAFPSINDIDNWIIAKAADPAGNWLLQTFGVSPYLVASRLFIATVACAFLYLAVEITYRLTSYSPEKVVTLSMGILVSLFFVTLVTQNNRPLAEKMAAKDLAWREGRLSSSMLKDPVNLYRRFMTLVVLVIFSPLILANFFKELDMSTQASILLNSVFILELVAHYLAACSVPPAHTVRRGRLAEAGGAA